MKKGLLRVLKVLLRAIGAFVAFVALYLLAAWLLPKIHVNKGEGLSDNGTAIYVLSNGVHTDIVLPIRTAGHDWSRSLRFEYTASKDTAMQYVAFGWGDKGFYLETPAWADLKASTAVKAMFGLSTTAMHVTFYKDLQPSDRCRKLLVDPRALENLVAYIGLSFQPDSAGSVQWIAGHSYERNDAFYEARGTYSLFFTCNSWTNDALDESGLPACFWTPFDTGILELYAR